MTLNYPEEYSTVPIVVADDEIILRSVDTRYIKKNGRIAPYLFTPPRGKTEISVMRLKYMRIEKCKMKGKSIASAAKEEFKGFAALKCFAVRKANAEVKDSREHFLGHADIIYSHPKPPEVQPNSAPEDCQALSEFREMLRQLVNACKFFPDPNPESGDWQGDSITL